MGAAGAASEPLAMPVAGPAGTAPKPHKRARKSYKVIQGVFPDRPATTNSRKCPDHRVGFGLAAPPGTALADRCAVRADGG